MEEIKSRVYIQTDAQNRVTRCEGGYSTPAGLTGWTCIDEGMGDRYNLCQSHYFEGGLYTMDGIPLYRWDGEGVVRRGPEEIAADRAALPEPEPDSLTRSQLAIAELARVVEENNTASQLAIAELAEALMGGEG